MAREGFVEGGPFYRGQTQNALFIARSGWQFIEFPLKAKELRSRVGTRVTRGAFVGNGRGGRVKWYLFSFPSLCTFSRVHAFSRAIENFPSLFISIFFIYSLSVFYIHGKLIHAMLFCQKFFAVFLFLMSKIFNGKNFSKKKNK